MKIHNSIQIADGFYGPGDEKAFLEAAAIHGCQFARLHRIGVITVDESDVLVGTIEYTKMKRRQMLEIERRKNEKIMSLETPPVSPSVEVDDPARTSLPTPPEPTVKKTTTKKPTVKAVSTKTPATKKRATKKKKTE